MRNQCLVAYGNAIKSSGVVALASFVTGTLFSLAYSITLSFCLDKLRKRFSRLSFEYGVAYSEGKKVTSSDECVNASSSFNWASKARNGTADLIAGC